MTNFDIVKKSREQGTDSLYLTKICQFYALSGIREQTLETMKIFDIVRYLGNRKQAPCIWLKFVTFRLYMGSGNRLLKTMNFLDILRYLGNREQASYLWLKFLTFRSHLGSGNRLLKIRSLFPVPRWDLKVRNLSQRQEACSLFPRFCWKIKFFHGFQKPVPWSQMRSKIEKFESKIRSLFPVPRF